MCCAWNKQNISFETRYIPHLIFERVQTSFAQPDFALCVAPSMQRVRNVCRGAWSALRAASRGNGTITLFYCQVIAYTLKIDIENVEFDGQIY
jgi:hypothetical protein